jgi:chitin synthase
MSIHDQLTSDTQPRHSRNLPLLEAVNASYLRSKCFQLDARTSVVVNSCHSSSSATPILDTSLGMKVWEHAKRRAEDNCILLQYVLSW